MMVAMHRRPVALVVAAAALVVASCGGGGDDGAQTAARTVRTQLAQRGARWSALAPADQLEVAKACRLRAAVAAAGADGAVSAPFYSDRYRAVERLGLSDLSSALTSHFSGTGNDDEPVGAACAGVAQRLADVPRLARRPHVELTPPVRAAKGPMTLTVATPDTRLLARVAPVGARLVLSRAADRAQTAARWTITQRGTRATLALRDIPLGVSYLRVGATGPRGRAGRLLVITRTHPTRQRPPRTFAPIALQGDRSRSMRVLYVPRDAIVAVRSPGPLAITTERALLLRDEGQGGGGPRPLPLRAGMYRDVRIAATGPWSLRITPAARQ